MMYVSTNCLWSRAIGLGSSQKEVLLITTPIVSKVIIPLSLGSVTVTVSRWTRSF